MALMLNAVFTENGAPKDGLTNAVIYIYDLLDNSLIVNGAAVTAVAKGGYKYNFTTYDGDKDYYIVWDSVDLTGHERYAYANIRSSTTSLDGIIEGNITLKQCLASLFARAAGIANGGRTQTINFRNQANTVDRIKLSSVTPEGNRGSTTLDFSDL